MQSAYKLHTDFYSLLKVFIYGMEAEVLLT
jgi:hypothetical protein